MRLLPFALLALTSPSVIGQNHLPNGNFRQINVCCEYHVSCAPMGWWTSSGSTFYLQKLRYDKQNKVIPPPVLVTMRGKKGYNERTYIQAPLLCPLEEGKEYEVEISLSFRKARFNEIGVLLCDSFIHIPKRTIYSVDTLTGYFQSFLVDSLLPFPPSYSVPLSDGLFAGKQTVKISFVATGREKFFLLGNFQNDSNTSFKGVSEDRWSPHYVQIHSLRLHGKESNICDCEEELAVLEELNRRHTFIARCEDSTAVDMNHLFRGISGWDHRYGKEEQEQQEEPLPFTPGTAYRIDRVYFDFDSAVLLPASFPALDSLAAVLVRFPDYTIEVGGHTDSFGSAAYNRELSERRAQAVVSYLVQAGIDPVRIHAIGYGSSLPLQSNSTDQGRQENRRVEFILREAAQGNKH